MARPSKPTAIKEAEGNPGKRSLNKREPKPARLSAEAIKNPPAWLPERAQVIWIQIAPMLDRMGVLTDVDTFALETACVAISNFRLATIKCGDVLVVRGNNNTVQINPYIIAQSMAFKQAMNALRDFGMTPSARSRLIAGGEEDGQDQQGRSTAQARSYLQ